MKKREAILSELKEHLPFTLVISFLAVVLVGGWSLWGEVPSEEFFEILHPAHVLVSALATSAIYYKYKRSVVLSIGVGVVGAILIGSLSDVLLPFLFGNLFLIDTHFHLPIIEETFLILVIAFLGAVVGMYRENWFRASHMSHVFLSVGASLFYLLAFGAVGSFGGFLILGGIVFLAVYVPCCISDIVFPLLFIDKPCRDCGHFH